MIEQWTALYGGKAAYLMAAKSKLVSDFEVPESIWIPIEAHAKWLSAGSIDLPLADIKTMLASGPCIVRSSSSYESNSKFESAGMFESIKCADLSEVQEAAKEIYNSARIYNEPHMGIIVQPIILGEHGIVMCSHHPDSNPNTPRRLVIQAAPKNPPVEITEQTSVYELDNIGQLCNVQFAGVATPNGTYLPGGRIPCDGILPPLALQRLHKMALALEKEFAMVIEIELILKGELIYLLQVRPLSRVNIPFDNILEEETRFGAGNYPDRVTALVGSLLEPAFSEQFGIKVSWSEAYGCFTGPYTKVPTPWQRYRTVLSQESFDVEILKSFLRNEAIPWLKRIFQYRTEVRESVNPKTWLGVLRKLIYQEMSYYFGNNAWLHMTSFLGQYTLDPVIDSNSMLNRYSTAFSSYRITELLQNVQKLPAGGPGADTCRKELLFELVGRSINFDHFDQPSYELMPNQLCEMLGNISQPELQRLMSEIDWQNPDLDFPFDQPEQTEQWLMYEAAVCLWFKEEDNYIKRHVYIIAREISYMLAKHLIGKGLIEEIEHIWDFTVDEIASMLEGHPAKSESILRRSNPQVWVDNTNGNRNETTQIAILGQPKAFAISGSIRFIPIVQLGMNLENQIILTKHADPVTIADLRPSPRAIFVVGLSPLTHVAHTLRSRSGDFPSFSVSGNTAQLLHQIETIELDYDPTRPKGQELKYTLR